MARIGPCECSDPGCPACKGDCRRAAVVVLFRVDMDDSSGVAFCQGCADDAMDAGVFTTETGEDCYAISPDDLPDGDGGEMYDAFMGA